ncbi:phage tail length tape measure family protein, partial [Clostridium tyrobutyricum]|uniref:phage tail length tape measure family protein n=1 Tax=Clostridium tyrobutyricum TaxID=1519 RepID=UPI001C386C82
SFESMMNSAKAGQKAMGQLNGVLKSTHQAAGMTSKQLTDLAAAQSRQTTFTKGQVIGAESLLLTFTKIGKKTFPDTMLAAENMSTAMGTDLKSSAMMLGKALNDPAAGLSKLTRSGVTFSAQQQKQIKDMQQAGNVAGAQKLMLQELNKEFGGQAVAAGNTYTGVITRIKNTLTGLGGSIGSQLVPYMAQFANALIKVTPVITDVVTTIVSTASPIIKDIVKDIGQIIKNLFPQFNGSMKNAKQITQEVVSNGLNKVKDVFDWMAKHGTAVKIAVIGIASAFAAFKTIGAINNTISTLKNFKKTVTDIKLLMSAKGEGGLLKGLFAGGPGIMLIITGIALGAYLIITHWTQIKTFFTGLFAWLKAFFSKWGLTIVTILFPFIGIPLQIIKHWSQI